MFKSWSVPHKQKFSKRRRSDFSQFYEHVATGIVLISWTKCMNRPFSGFLNGDARARV